MRRRSIKLWPREDRPRERLFRYGEHHLTDTELLAILLRSGIKGESAVDLSRKVLQRFKTFRNIANVDFSQWKEIKGLGIAKIAQIRAGIEIGRRFGEQRDRHKKPMIKSSKDVADILLPRMANLKKEVFKVVLLNGQNRIIDIIEIMEGTVNQVHTTIREVFYKTLQYYAAAIICVHNHPSGCVTPSSEDKRFTQDLVKSGKALQIMVLDHIIIGDAKYFSFVDKGLL
ncbi:MAG: DNA repair protein RadC [Candidatus Omnitrophica bacterium]|nr:DNA repair protein RadC [Candidatus Omnitrophota bacterium]